MRATVQSLVPVAHSESKIPTCKALLPARRISAHLARVRLDPKHRTECRPILLFGLASVRSASRGTSKREKTRQAETKEARETDAGCGQKRAKIYIYILSHDREEGARSRSKAAKSGRGLKNPRQIMRGGECMEKGEKTKEARCGDDGLSGSGLRAQSRPRKSDTAPRR